MLGAERDLVRARLASGCQPLLDRAAALVPPGSVTLTSQDSPGVTS